jgi:hypothetical protein
MSFLHTFMLLAQPPISPLYLIRCYCSVQHELWTQILRRSVKPTPRWDNSDHETDKSNHKTCCCTPSPRLTLCLHSYKWSGLLPHKTEWPNNRQDTNSPVSTHFLQKYMKLMYNGEQCLSVCPQDSPTISTQWISLKLLLEIITAPVSHQGLGTTQCYTVYNIQPMWSTRRMQVLPFKHSCNHNSDKWGK